MMGGGSFRSREWKVVEERREGRWRDLAGRKLRFDRAPESRGESSALPELLRQWSRTSSRERGGPGRADAGCFRVWLGWKSGGREFLAAPADLLNISEDGALVRLATPLSALREVWVCLGDPADADEGVLATALDVTPVHDGQWVARLEFDTASAETFMDLDGALSP